MALLAALATAAWGVGTAAAETPPPTEATDQAAASGQAAGAASGAAQSQPSNLNISVRVLSPGSDGDVTQSNTVSSTASATNANVTNQSAGQTQSGAGIQTAGQDASSAQLAAALSSSHQLGASNTNIPVRVLSPGGGGDVTQTNAAGSESTAVNANFAKQDADQTQAGGGCPCPGTAGVQTAEQSASSKQAAVAKSEAEQKDAKNTNIAVRVLSPGDDGDVTQTNAVSSSAKAANVGATKQTVDQVERSGDAKCCPSGPGVQTAKQDAESEQKAAATSSAVQLGASNTNIPVRVLSPGGSGDVTQTNSVRSSATAENINATGQSADQDQAGAGGPAVQWSGQSASSTQAALAGSHALQAGASNTNLPVRVLSPGGDGDVTQSNSVASSAKAANLNLTKQDAEQTQAGGQIHLCCPSGPSIQTSEQKADSTQAALAKSAAIQLGEKDTCGCPAGNTNAPVRVKSPGWDGDVIQTNSVASAATAGNLNLTEQHADQTQAGGAIGRCCPTGPSIQILGQKADSSQAALAGSLAFQTGASNSNAPVRVHSPGGGGDVTQTNDARSAAVAGNTNLTGQKAVQAQGGGGIAIQVLGQKASSHQLAGAGSAAFQLGAANRNTPVLVHSPGGSGDVTQANTVASAALATNLDLTKQHAGQIQRGGVHTCCQHVAIQALGQAAESKQVALAHSLALQLWGKHPCGCRASGNAHAPVQVKSPGRGGHVSQTNAVASGAGATNLDAAHQAASQAQGSGGIAIQALGQAAWALQLSAAGSLAAQVFSGHERRAF